MDLQQHWFAVLDALAAGGVEHAVCGGFAVAIHGYPRLTKDIDLLVLESDLARARAALTTAGFTLDSGLLEFGAGTPNERRLWRLSKAEGEDLVTVDLLLVGPSLVDVWRSREEHQLRQRKVTVVSRAGLATMKRLAGRPRDIDDLRQLGLEPQEPDGRR
jgi:hypothetical protein